MQTDAFVQWGMTGLENCIFEGARVTETYQLEG